MGQKGRTTCLSSSFWDQLCTSCIGSHQFQEVQWAGRRKFGIQSGKIQVPAWFVRLLFLEVSGLLQAPMLKRNILSLWQGDRSSITQWGILDTWSSGEQCFYFKMLYFIWKLIDTVTSYVFWFFLFVSSSEASFADKLVRIIKSFHINILFLSYLFSSLINISVWSWKCDICLYKKCFFPSPGAGLIAQREGRDLFKCTEVRREKQKRDLLNFWGEKGV